VDFRLPGEGGGWKTTTIEALRELVAGQLLDCTGHQRSFFEEHRVDFYPVPIRSLGSIESVFVIAEFGDAVMYYEEVEEGFELATLDEDGAIQSRGCSQFELRHVLNRLQAHEAHADVEIGAATLGQELFVYLATIVPYWRVSDDAWLLYDEAHLCGIGVLRSYGGDVLVIPWSEDPELLRCLRLPRMGSALPDYDRRIVIVDDRKGEHWELVEKRISPVPVIPWSDRPRLSEYVIRDAPGA
jgi:hypothetical protein